MEIVDAEVVAGKFFFKDICSNQSNKIVDTTHPVEVNELQLESGQNNSGLSND